LGTIKLPPIDKLCSSQLVTRTYVARERPEYTNHRIRVVEVGRDLWRSSGPIPLLKQGHLEPVTQENIQMAFESL